MTATPQVGVSHMVAKRQLTTENTESTEKKSLCALCLQRFCFCAKRAQSRSMMLGDLGALGGH